jgi:hypothetical protein
MLQYTRDRLPAPAPTPYDCLCDRCLLTVITVMAHTGMPAYPAVLTEAAWPQPGGRFVHVGVHPCFCGGFADRSDPAAVVIRPGYPEGHWTKVSWTTGGVGAKAGATHLPLPSLMHAFLNAGLTPERLAEGRRAHPATLAIRARRRP